MRLSAYPNNRSGRGIWGRAKPSPKSSPSYPEAIRSGIRGEQDAILRWVAHQQPGVVLLDRDAGGPHALDHLRQRRLVRQDDSEMAQAGGLGRRRRGAHAGPDVQPEVMVVAAG